MTSGLATDEPLLTGHPAVAARSAADLAEALSRGGYAHRVSVAAPDASFQTLGNYVALGGVSLYYCRFGAPMEIGFGPSAGFRQAFCRSGAARLTAAGRSVDLSRSTSVIVPPGQAYEASYNAACAQLTVQVDERIVRLYGEHVGLNADRDLPVLRPLRASALERLRAIAFAIAGQFNGPGAPRRSIVAALRSALIASFLTENHAAAREAPDAPPDLADRLERYVEENWNRPITVEDIAGACGVSVRSVFASFKRRHGTAPMTFLRDLRLERARNLLAGGDGDTSVLDVAMSCGFASFGHFSGRYREKYGELPSATLARARLQAPEQN